MWIEKGGARVDEVSRILPRVILEYPALWQRIVHDWTTSVDGDFAWLTYSANYLLSAAGLKWALDPFSLSTRVPGVTQPNFMEDLAGLSLIVLSHQHNDHLDLNLIGALSHLPIAWIIPDFMLEYILARVQIPWDNIIIPQAGRQISIKGLTLTPFSSLHFHGERGVPEMGYLAEFNHTRWLFPGDIRNYEIGLLPDFGRLDGVFAHIWLGKAGALIYPPPFIEKFCRFFSNFKAQRLIITHLNEYGRDDRDRWDTQHYQLVKTRLNSITPRSQVMKAGMGDKVDLSEVE